MRNSLSQSDAEKLVHAVITFRLDYCNSLLAGHAENPIKSLQLIKKTTAKTGTRGHISSILASLHWVFC